MNGTKKEPDFPTFPPALTAEKPFEPARSRDDLAPYNTPFYPNQQLGMDATNNGFKQEINTVIKHFVIVIHLKLSSHQQGFCMIVKYVSQPMPMDYTLELALVRQQSIRTISDDKRYVCKRNQRCNNASRDGTGYRKICRSCRMKRCLEIGMLPENVQHKRNRRESNSPHNKIQLDTFFNGFYPAFPSQATTAPADTTQPADPCHS
ncbi:CBN-ODR-7 protein [Caenorhabditis brenneri]|uniref:CBN-ODR-7 protein n=1 Tax=Caenorhabditis brenneri TaxID=135651 RepID=G0MX95_CAEBE|nr:CBN-ODR-7 protein [Caenorhabditis brenneri]